MIYVITYSKIAPGEANGSISDLFENAFTDRVRAHKVFDDLVLTAEYFRKELWVIEPGGKRKLLKEKKYSEKRDTMA